MSRRYPTLLTVVFTFLCVFSAAQAGDKEKKRSPARASIALFNGRDLSGWTYFLRNSDVKMEDVWSVKEGILVCKGKPAGYIRTKKDYDNYRLTLEWRWPKGSQGGNSGVLLHMTGVDRVWPKSIEAQLFRGNAGDFWVIGGNTIEIPNAEKRRKGRRHLNLTDDSEKPIGEWNKMEVTCQGDEIIVKVNGDLVNHGSKSSATRGAICLQSEGTEIHFRNVRLTPLK